ncbi:hypothetical protein JG688_00014291 [Phytophthora aleatoria]|uniref:Uncharacterized protein n=1 Tax=Phytophthora aleatoria TaxID=2496075 RepID=A0A8J5IG59_9STRA|nr:hypothetical protein JG688_00014291 [Phytophthora aleatoria]
MIARDRILSNTIMDVSVRCICSILEDCYALDTFVTAFGCLKPPRTQISSTHYVVLLVHLGSIHLGVIIVAIAYKTEVPSFTSYYNEPFCKTAYRVTMGSTYEEMVAPFLRNWHYKTM